MKGNELTGIRVDRSELSLDRVSGCLGFSKGQGLDQQIRQ
ncbi:MAG: hypothetical protein ACI87A_001341 [Planctomycetota bacterium]|jgi:hypothetical protein